MPYSLRLLGRFELLAPSGAAVEIGAKKSQALVAMLALAGGAPVPRSRLTAVLWGDRGEEQARSSLRQAFTALRKAFEGLPGFPFVITEETAAIDPAGMAVDLAALSGEIPVRGRVFGEFLEGLYIPGQPTEDWLEAERQRLARFSADLSARQIAAAEAAGDTAGAAAAADAMLRADPLSEAAHRALARAMAAGGDRTGALRQLQTCRELLKAELGIEPDAETRKLEVDIRAGQPAAAAPPAAATRPTVAVLPFINLSADPEQEYFSDGITDDIITELGRFRNLNVIARISAFHFKGRNPLGPEVGEKLGADYAVQGSIRKVGNRVRITVQLSETSKGRQMWAEHFDRELVDIFALQDEITDTIAGLVHGRLDVASQQRAMRLEPERLGAYDLCLRAKATLWKFKPGPNADGRRLLEQAIALDPQNSLAHALLASAHLHDWMEFWVPDRAAALDLAARHSRRAVDLDRDDSRAHWGLAEVLHYRREFAEARAQFEEAQRLNPNDIQMLYTYGLFQVCQGEYEAGLSKFERASRLNPFDSYVIPWLHGAACYIAGRYPEAVRLLNRISDPLAEVHAWLTAAYAQMGQMEAARRHCALFLAAARAEMPTFPGRRSEDWRAYCEDLTTGLPEHGRHFHEGLARAWPSG